MSLDDVPEEAIDKMSKAFDVWEAKFGRERALVIAAKMASPQFILEHTVLELISTGDKWHFANLLFNHKISNEEFMEKFK